MQCRCGRGFIFLQVDQDSIYERAGGIGVLCRFPEQGRHRNNELTHIFNVFLVQGAYLANCLFCRSQDGCGYRQLRGRGS